MDGGILGEVLFMMGQNIELIEPGYTDPPWF